MRSHDMHARMGALDGLIKHMRKLEAKGMRHEDKEEEEEGMRHKMGKPHEMEMEIEIEKRPMHEKMKPHEFETGKRDHEGMRGPLGDEDGDMDRSFSGGDVDTEEEDEHEEEMSPLHKEMGDFFNDRHRPKMGNGMVFMSDEDMPKRGMGRDHGGMKPSGMQMPSREAKEGMMPSKKKRGRPEGWRKKKAQIMSMIIDDVINGILTRTLFATNQITVDTSQLIALLNSIIQLDLVGMIDSTNGEYFIRTIDVPIVPNQSSYRIPYRAMGRMLRDLKFHDTDPGNERWQNMILIDINDLQFYQVGYKNYAGYYFKSDSVVIVPPVSSDVSATANLQMWYKLKPNYPCLMQDAAQVISVSGNVVTVNTVPTTMTNGTLIDFIQGVEGCDIYSFDQSITNAGVNTLTFATGVIPTDLTAGDWISIAQTSPVVNFIPDEARGLIENMTGQLLLNSVGDVDGANTFSSRIEAQKTALLKMVEPRTDGNAQVILNRYSLARGRRYWYGLYGGGVITP